MKKLDNKTKERLIANIGYYKDLNTIDNINIKYSVFINIKKPTICYEFISITNKDGINNSIQGIDNIILVSHVKHYTIDMLLNKPFDLMTACFYSNIKSNKHYYEISFDNVTDFELF